MSPDVIIVGGGIWGLCIALHLRRTTRLRVLVLERRSTPGAETTSQSAGHVGLLRGHPMLTQGVQDTLACLRRLQASQPPGEPLFRRLGSVTIATSVSRLRKLLDQAELGRQAGVAVELLEREQVLRVVPGLVAEAVIGGCAVHDDVVVDPRRLAGSLARAVELHGGSIRYSSMVDTVSQTNRGPLVATNHGAVSCGACVIAAGPWSARLLSGLGVSLPFAPIRLQQALTAPHANASPSHPVVRLPDQAMYLQPEAGGFLVGVFQARPASLASADVAPQWSTDDLAAPEDVIAEARQRLARVLPSVAQLPLVGYRQGLTTFTPDALPLIGRVDDDSQILVASGCNGFGVALAGGVGRWMAAALTDPYLDPAIRALSPLRFASVARNVDWLRAQAEARYVHYEGEPVPPGSWSSNPVQHVPA
jgi:4-methylaminobutanoate oxidase (formaldehyde-forming)